MARSEPSKTHVAAWRALLRAQAAAVRRMDADLRAAGRLPLEDYDVLIELSTAPDQRLRLSELAGAVLLSRSGVTRLVDRLERRHLVRRLHCEHDGRGTWAELTAAGRRAIRDSWPVYGDAIARWFAAHVTTEEARVVLRALRRVFRNADDPT